MHTARLLGLGLLTGALLLVACGEDEDGNGKGSDPSAPPSGSLVAAFGTDGIVAGNPSSSWDQPTGVALDATHMYVVGFDATLGSSDDQWRIEKRSLDDGALDPSFGTAGVIQTNPGTGTDWIWAIALDATSLYVGGWDKSPGDLQWRVEKRSLSDGALDAGFGTGGVVTSNPTGAADSLAAMLVESDGLYLVGSSEGDSRIEKRSTATGALVTAFGAGGVVVPDPDTYYDLASAVATDGRNLFIAGRDQSLGAGDWSLRIEKRSLATGALDAAFGAGGTVTSSPSPTYDAGSAIAYGDGWIYIAGTDEGPGAGDRQFRIEKRSAIDGTLDPAFGAAGAVTQDLGAGDEEFLSIVLDADFLYAGGTDESSGDGQWNLQKRRRSDGSLVDSFGSGGLVTENLSPYWDGIEEIAVDAAGLYVVGAACEAVDDGAWRIEKRVK